MNINRNNYQEFFLDYFEGALEPHEVAELMVFLEANPDLNSEFEDFEEIKLLPVNKGFQNKKSLKKHQYKTVGEITAFNYEEWLVAGIENDLSPKEQGELESFLDINPPAKLEYSHFIRSRLIPEEVMLENKDELKKKGVILFYRPALVASLAIAASILIFLAVYLQVNNQPDNQRIATTTELERIEPVSGKIVIEEKVHEVSLRDQQLQISQPLEILNTSETTLLSENWPDFAGMEALRINPDVLSANFGTKPTLLAINTRQDYITEPNVLPSQPLIRETKSSFASRFINGVFSNIFGKRDPNKKSLLEYTVDGYNLMADREVEVEKHYDASGNLVAYRVNGELVKIGHKVNSTLGE